MFNPSFCQELFKRQPARRHPRFPVRDTRHPRRGQTGCSSGKRDNHLSVNRLQRCLIRKDERHKKGGLYDILETSKTSNQRPVVSPQRHRGQTC